MNLEGGLPIAAGATVVVRDEEWLVRAVASTKADGLRVDVRGTSELVRDQPATFFTSLDQVSVLDPSQTKLITDDSSNYLRSRLWLESLLRESSVPMSETRIIVGHRGLQDQMSFQLRPAQLALTNPHPRILIADAVGLGKTIEIGIILSDLIRRGRGERILIVTPRAVLEQFQREMWTKFAIPLVRLDSEGIQKVRQTLPASRNPFSYFRRVIVSIDTLKNPVRYRHHLQSQRWDAVVIDECHNLINRGTQNHQLAQVLARQTDALILSSATPHNGRAESFAELIELLDPTAIKDKSNYTAAEIESLYVRRHRNSDDVKHEVGDKWAPRLEPQIVPVPASAQEEAVLRELHNTWLRPPAGKAQGDKRRRLFPWTLFKGFLSSPGALQRTIDIRRKSIEAQPDGDAEITALDELTSLNQAVLASGSSKLDALVDYLKTIGVGPGKATRIVIFSERIATLEWLETELRSRLKLKASAVATLHAKLPDNQVQDVVEQFALSGSGLRVLLASDMASEGLNLHLECHHLVHFDLPWSFIRIQQRNGRIDRYLQRRSSQITALALTSVDTDIDSDLRVVTKLLQKEHAANQALGDSAVLLNLGDEDVEEEAVMEALAKHQDLDELVPDIPDLDPLSFEMIFATSGEHDHTDVTTVEPATLFEDEDNFLYAALTDLFPGGKGLDIVREPDKDLIAFDTPPDLARMLGDLPSSYLKAQKVGTRIRLTGSRDLALARLEAAKNQGDTLWPDVHYLAPTHPVLSWAASRLMARVGRNEAPVMSAQVDEPIFLTQALWSNAHGQAAMTYWGALTGLKTGTPRMDGLVETLRQAGITENATNPGTIAGMDALQALVPAAVQAAANDLRQRRAEIEAPLRARVEEEQARVRDWTLFAIDAAEDSPIQLKKRRKSQAERTTTQALDYLESLLPAGQPYIRVIGVIAPAQGVGANV